MCIYDWQLCWALYNVCRVVLVWTPDIHVADQWLLCMYMVPANLVTEKDEHWNSLPCRWGGYTRGFSLCYWCRESSIQLCLVQKEPLPGICVQESKTVSGRNSRLVCTVDWLVVSCSPLCVHPWSWWSFEHSTRKLERLGNTKEIGPLLRISTGREE